MYANLAQLKLPYAEAVFTISYFRDNPIPFYTLAHELYPGQYRPTIAHAFIRLLAEKGLLLKLFSQNIDCLEREAGVPEDKIVEAHGSFATQSCIDCKTAFPEDLMKKAIDEQDVPHCQVPQCNGLVKPDIVFFGEGLPEKFFQARALPESADLCIVMGTSLTVQPFASLPSLCTRDAPRLLVNMERVGDLGSRPDDVLLLGDCDTGIRKLAGALGWQDELEDLWATIKPELAKPEPDKARSEKTDDTLDSKVASLTEEVDKSLKISDVYFENLKSYLDRKLEAPLTARAEGIKSEHSAEASEPRRLFSSPLKPCAEDGKPKIENHSTENTERTQHPEIPSITGGSNGEAPASQEDKFAAAPTK